MKLIIDIPDSILDTIQADKMISREQLAVLQMNILNGTQLDSNSERAEAQAYFDGQAYGYGWEKGRKALIDDVKTEIEHMACRQYEHRLMLDRQETLEIIDKYIGKTESEVYNADSD